MDKTYADTTRENIKDVYEKVEEWLSVEPRTRNSDKFLVLQIWAEQTSYDTNIFDLIAKSKDIFEPESITRARRKIQNDECRFLPTDPKVAIRRKIKESVLKLYYGDKSKEWKEYQELRYVII